MDKVREAATAFATKDPHMLRAGLIAVFAIALTATAMARSETRRSDPPRKTFDKTDKTLDKPMSRGPNSCAAFGPGFVKIDGSDTCVRVGGSIDVSVGGRTGAR